MTLGPWGKILVKLDHFPIFGGEDRHFLRCHHLVSLGFLGKKSYGGQLLLPWNSPSPTPRSAWQAGHGWVPLMIHLNLISLGNRTCNKAKPCSWKTDSLKLRWKIGGVWDSPNPGLQEVAQISNDSMSNGTLCQARIWKLLWAQTPVTIPCLTKPQKKTGSWRSNE